MDVTIRRYEARDAAGVADVMFRSVREAALTDYSPEQVRAWLPDRPDPAAVQSRASDGRSVWVAVDAQGRLVAYIDLEGDGHIDHLYAVPEAVGHGVGARLSATVERAAREWGIATLSVEASEPARRMFEREGFTVLLRRELVRDGVALHNYAMSKSLRDAGPATV